ncbi:putative secologanin synthase [Helianthus anomalus]
MLEACGGVGKVAAFVAVVVVVVYEWRFFNWVWLKPKKKEKCLRNQGLKGTSYRFLYGDIKEMVKMITDAYVKPINLNDDIVPRVMSFAHRFVTTHGICL